MTYNREILLPNILKQIRQQTIDMDIVIWNNGRDFLIYDNDVDYFKGNNETGMIQRFLPALIYPHKYVMFIDDDVIIGKRFSENALSIINDHPEAVVTTLGSIMDCPVSEFSVRNRFPVVGKDLKNNINLHLDIGCLGCSVMLRKHVQCVFRDSIIPPFFCEDILFYMSHKVHNRGTVILSRHDDAEIAGITGFQPEHNTGIISDPNFYENRMRYIISLSDRLNWKPNAKTFPEWESYRQAFIKQR